MCIYLLNTDCPITQTTKVSEFKYWTLTLRPPTTLSSSFLLKESFEFQTLLRCITNCRSIWFHDAQLFLDAERWMQNDKIKLCKIWALPFGKDIFFHLSNSSFGKRKLSFLFNLNTYQQFASWFLHLEFFFFFNWWTRNSKLKAFSF